MSSQVYCGKHPQERVVGVCSSCLAKKLFSLTYSSIECAPEILGRSCAGGTPRNSPPPGLIDWPSIQQHLDQGHLQTNDEEAGSSGQRVEKGALLSLTHVQGCGEAEVAGNSSEHSKCSVGQTSLCHRENYPIEGASCSCNQEVAGTDSLEGGGTKTLPYLRANKPIKCKRSKSICALRGDCLRKIEQEAHALESAATIRGDQNITGAKKATLRTLFQLDDEHKWRDTGLLARDTCESERFMRRFSTDDKPTEEEIDGSSICDFKTIEEAKHVRHDNYTHSHRCVPSASALSSSVCPSMPSKLKHSALLKSLLCRKTGDDKRGSGSVRRKPSQVNDVSRADFTRRSHEGGPVRASDDGGGFVKATYIASESRDEALRRCKSKLERSVARSSMSSSQPEESTSSLRTHGIDMKSERKFNLSARALAAELPLILGSSAEATPMIPRRKAKSPSSASATGTRIEDCEEMLARLREGHPGVLHSAAAVLDWEIAEATENVSFSVSGTNAQGKVEDVGESAEMSLSKCPDAKYVPSISQAGGMVAFMARATTSPEVAAYAGSSVAGAAAAPPDQGKAAEIPDGMPAYITVAEEGGDEDGAVGGPFFSCSKSIAGEAAQQDMEKLAEKVKTGGGWEAYSSKPSTGVRRLPSASSSTGKIAAARSGLLRFYLTPLRASGQARLTATRRPPNRHFWPLIFI